MITCTATRRNAEPYRFTLTLDSPNIENHNTL